jgi:hypothetical protein
MNSERTRHIEKLYAWLCAIQMENGLVPSFEFRRGNENEDGTEVSTYDNALAVIEFSRRGDLERAERILDFFISRIHVEFDAGSGGFSQFRFATSGEPRDSSRWMGDVAWLLIALKHYHGHSSENKYRGLEERMISWLRGLQDSDGGLFAGSDGDGNLRTEKVVEGNIDAFNAVPGFDDFHRRLLKYLSEKRWDRETDMFIAWEGTGEMALAYAIAGREDSWEYYLSEMERMFIPSNNFSGLYALPYTTDDTGTHYGYWTLRPEVDKSPWVASTVWYLFAAARFNPFSPGLNKSIPPSHHPWKS